MLADPRLERFFEIYELPLGAQYLVLGVRPR